MVVAKLRMIMGKLGGRHRNVPCTPAYASIHVQLFVSTTKRK